MRRWKGLWLLKSKMQVLQWTRDWGTAQRLAFEVALAVSREFQTLSEPLPGVKDWLLALKSVNVPCALVTCLDRCLLASPLSYAQHLEAK